MQHDYNGFPHQDIAHRVAAAFPGLCAVLEHRGLKLLVPTFPTEQAVHLSPCADTEVLVDRDEPVIVDIDTTWDIAKHASVRAPVSLGVVDERVRSAFCTPLPPWCSHVLDMPIKFPGTDVRVPAALSGFIPAIQRVIDIERQLNPRFDRYYAYLSVHQARLAAGERMRENPYHVDGFQGPRWPVKHPVNHSYLLCDALPTVFYPMAFPLADIDPVFDDVYAEFEHVISSAPRAPVWRARDFELILMDAYCVHRGDVAREPVLRTWMRISWETRVFDRLGNAHNPLFDYDWEMVARDTDPRVRPRDFRAMAAA